jgi:RNA polymerase-binding transcription factor DksA
MNEENMSLYATVLSELTEQELKAGVLKCMRTCKFFPSIAEIMEVSNDMVQVATKTKAKSPDEAWNEVQRQMQEAFIYKEPKFSTPEIKTAALAMGWIGLCETPTDQIGTARAQFLRLYESVCKRKKEDRINNNVMQIMGGQNKTANLISKVTKLMP